MHPLRISICTYNLWNRQRWPAREPALRQFLARFQPDILCTQELQPETRDCIDDVLSGHIRVKDDPAGWNRESNIWWRADLFRRLAHGIEDIGHDEPDRGLFWVRLARPDRNDTLFVATTHLTHPRNEREAETGQSPRIGQARAMIDALDRVVGDGEAAWVSGDFNDAVHVPAMLHEAGFRACFSDLAVQPPPTFPALPTATVGPGEYFTSATFDWITAQGPVRVLAASSPQQFTNDLSPSDHWPVLAVYEL